MSSAKKFDCVDMKREGALRVHERTASMSPEEKLEYWRGRTNELRRLAKPEPAQDLDDEARP